MQMTTHQLHGSVLLLVIYFGVIVIYYPQIIQMEIWVRFVIKMVLQMQCYVMVQ